jgi:hypothetical protein
MLEKNEKKNKNEQLFQAGEMIQEGYRPAICV